MAANILTSIFAFLVVKGLILSLSKINLTPFDIFSRKLLFSVHCRGYVIVANAVSGCYFPLVSCNTRVKHMAFGMFSWPLLSYYSVRRLI